MIPDPTELARVLDWLDKRSGGPGAGYSQEYADAARLLREIAADFKVYAYEHRMSCVYALGDLADQFTPCSCGLDAARAKWRLEL